MLCCAVLCCAVLCCGVLCSAVPCRDVLCCDVLCCAVLCLAVLCCDVLCCDVLCCAVLCCAVPCCDVLCCAVLCCLSGKMIANIYFGMSTRGKILPCTAMAWWGPLSWWWGCFVLLSPTLPCPAFSCPQLCSLTVCYHQRHACRKAMYAWRRQS